MKSLFSYPLLGAAFIFSFMPLAFAQATDLFPESFKDGQGVASYRHYMGSDSNAQAKIEVATSKFTWGPGPNGEDDTTTYDIDVYIWNQFDERSPRFLYAYQLDDVVLSQGKVYQRCYDEWRRIGYDNGSGRFSFEGFYPYCDDKDKTGVVTIQFNTDGSYTMELSKLWPDSRGRHGTAQLSF